MVPDAGNGERPACGRRSGAGDAVPVSRAAQKGLGADPEGSETAPESARYDPYFCS